VLLAAGACGRFGFDAQSHAGDATISDGDGSNGSGSAAPFVAPWHSGPRLRARLLIGGGDPIFYGWHDAQLDTDCQAALAADGIERCMPYRVRAADIYSDASCTQPLALTYPATCGKDTYAFTDSGNGAHAFPIAAPYTGQIYTMAGSCMPTSLPTGQLAFKLGAEEPSSSFVASSYTRQTIGNFMHSFNDFSDGASIDIGTLILSTTSCYPFATELGTVRCRTGAKRATHAYSDGGCMQPILAWARTPYDPMSTSLLEVFPPQACDSTYTLYQTIADVTAPQYWVKDALGCPMITTPTNVVLYTATEIADPAPIGTLARGPDRGRIGTFYWTGPDNVAIPVGNFDQSTGAPCTPFNAADGVLRCLPSRGTSETASEDGTCSGAARSIYGACYAAAPVYGPDYSSCTDGPWTVKSLPTQVPTASLFDDGTCDSIDLPIGGGFDGATGAVIPASTFPALTEMVE